MLYVNVLLFFTTVLSSMRATNTIMRYVYFEKEHINNISQTIVEATFDRKTIPECASICLIEKAAKCYCNNKTDGAAAVDSIVFARVTRTYEASRSDGKDETTYFIDDGIGYDSCEELAGAGYRSPGIYSVKNSMLTGVKEMYCTMDSDEWTVFQKRFDGSEDFYRNWADYVNGFGSLGGEFWLGLEAIHQATSSGTCELVIIMEAENSHPVKASGYVKYSSFRIDGADTNYTLHVSDFSGTDGIGDCLIYHANQAFSTYDADNDQKNTASCATEYEGAWWYNSCHRSNLNGRYLEGNHPNVNKALGMEWNKPWGWRYSLLRTQMMYKCT